MKSTLGIIAQREYVQRVTSKGFIIGTLVGPLIMIALIAVPILILMLVQDRSPRTIAVVDYSNVLFADLEFPIEYDLIKTNAPVDTLRRRVERSEIDGYLVLPSTLLGGRGSAEFYSRGGGGIVLWTQLQQAVNRAVRHERVLRTGASNDVLDILDQDVAVNVLKITMEGDTPDSPAALAGIGYTMGFVIYLCMFIYGAFVMRGVIEEKTNRIAELMASSARPFDLMMGKVLGIGAMGLTQFLAWCILGITIMAFGGSILALFIDPADYGLPASVDQSVLLKAADITIPRLPFSSFVIFVLFFVGGYLLYASMFAAVGSAVDQESDAQQFVLPITGIIIVPMLLLTSVIENPDSSLSFWLSIVPFFSPILMTVRVAATSVPLWQTTFALVLLVGSFLASIWVSSRIYRVGILMYGKKPSFADIGRWLIHG